MTYKWLGVLCFWALSAITSHVGWRLFAIPHGAPRLGMGTILLILLPMTFVLGCTLPENDTETPKVAIFGTLILMVALVLLSVLVEVFSRP